MKFSWGALILAPLIVPCGLSALFVLFVAGGNPFFGFLLFSAIGSVISYVTTVLLFLPCLCLLSRLMPLTGVKVSLTGAVLGLFVSIPVTWVEYGASGVDSGPPEGTFAAFFVGQLAEPVYWVVYPLGGLITAGAYWLIARTSRA